jgi:hypothetical protein
MADNEVVVLQGQLLKGHGKEWHQYLVIAMHAREPIEERGRYFVTLYGLGKCFGRMEDGEDIRLWEHLRHHVQYSFTAAAPQIPIVDQRNARIAGLRVRRRIAIPDVIRFVQ